MTTVDPLKIPKRPAREHVSNGIIGWPAMIATLSTRSSMPDRLPNRICDRRNALCNAHQSLANRRLRLLARIVRKSYAEGARKGNPGCFSVTHLDGIVFSRAAFNHNVNFRSVMAFGTAEFCEEEVKRKVLPVFVDRLAPGLWEYARKPTDSEWKATKVIRLKLDEVSAKVSDGLPDEDPEDLAAASGLAPSACVWCSNRLGRPEAQHRNRSTSFRAGFVYAK